MNTNINFENIWVEEKTFTFTWVERYLQWKLKDEDNSLALVPIAYLFHKMGEIDTQNNSLDKIEKAIEHIPLNPRDSGQQLRDCLILCGYSYILNAIGKKERRFSKVTNAYINYAKEQIWFDNPKLAALVAVNDSFQSEREHARQYFKDNIGSWISKGIFVGVVFFLLVDEIADDSNALSVFSNREWESEEIENLAWGLIALSKTKHSNKNNYLLNKIAKLIIEYHNEFVEQVNFPEGKINRQRETYELALSALSLHETGFDSMVGVPKFKINEFEKLHDVTKKLGNILNPEEYLISKRTWNTFRLLTSITLVSVAGIISPLIEDVSQQILVLLFSAIISILLGINIPGDSLKEKITQKDLLFIKKKIDLGGNKDG